MSDKTETVPFHLANVPGEESPVKLINGRIFELSDQRRIEVWQVATRPGVCVRIFRPTLDGKTCKLVFGLSPEAASVLALALAGTPCTRALHPQVGDRLRAADGSAEVQVLALVGDKVRIERLSREGQRERRSYRREKYHAMIREALDCGAIFYPVQTPGS